MRQDDGSVSMWVERMKAGDKGLPVEKLWERYFKRLIELARANLGRLPRRAADEEDVALSAFNSFCQGALRGNFPQLNDRTSLWRLLVTITARKAYQLKLTHGRQKRGGDLVLDEAGLARQSKPSAAAVRLEHFIATEPTPEFAVQAAEEFQHILRRLGNERLRNMVQWKMEGYTNEEIAAKLACAPRTVVRRLLLIRSTLADLEEP
jgi:DNA-directed RNA polymerase specialized sigma24 family protein